MKPGWNAHVRVGEMKTKVGYIVGLGWAVADDVPGDPLDYVALITLTLPPRASASVQKKAPNETVVLDSDASLTCGATIGAIVTYLVSPKQTGANGKVVEVNIADISGLKPPPTGAVLGHATGQIGQNITVRFSIPRPCA